MEVAAVTGEVAERLRHEGRDQAALLRERLDHVAEEDGAVAGGERVRELEVLLELAVRVLVVVRVVVPAELRHVARDLRHEVEVAREGAHVVTGLVERVERVGELDRAVFAQAHEEVLELRAEHELVAEIARAVQLTAQDRARAVGPLVALDVHVTGEARHARLPRQRCERADVRHRRHVRVVRLLADRAGGEAREARALAEQAVQVRGRYELGARLAVHVDELREQELDVVLADVALDVLAGARRSEWLGHAPQRTGCPRWRPMCSSAIFGPQTVCRPTNVGSAHSAWANCSAAAMGGP